MTAGEQRAGGLGTDVLHWLPNLKVVINVSRLSAPWLANSKDAFSLSSHAITHSVSNIQGLYISTRSSQSIYASPIQGSCHLASIKAQQQLTP